MLSKVLLGHSVGILHLSTFTLATTVQKKCSWLKIQMSKESLVDYGFPEFVAFMMFLCAIKYSLWQYELLIIIQWWNKGPKK